MKLVTHERRVDSREVGTPLSNNPMSVWLSKSIEMRIESGDVLKLIAETVEVHWVITKAQARQVVGFWFALGERRRLKKQGGWTKKELDASPKRFYRPKG